MSHEPKSCTVGRSGAIVLLQGPLGLGTGSVKSSVTGPARSGPVGQHSALHHLLCCPLHSLSLHLLSATWRCLFPRRGTGGGVAARWGGMLGRAEQPENWEAHVFSCTGRTWRSRGSGKALAHHRGLGKPPRTSHVFHTRMAGGWGEGRGCSDFSY